MKINICLVTKHGNGKCNYSNGKIDKVFGYIYGKQNSSQIDYKRWKWQHVKVLIDNDLFYFLNVNKYYIIKSDDKIFKVRIKAINNAVISNDKNSHKIFSTAQISHSKSACICHKSTKIASI